MQKIIVEIEAKGYTGLTAENIKKALDYYFGSPALHVSFSVTEAAQPSVQATATTPRKNCHENPKQGCS
jgi:hypothetical protein